MPLFDKLRVAFVVTHKTLKKTVTAVSNFMNHHIVNTLLIKIETPVKWLKKQILVKISRKKKEK